MIQDLVVFQKIYDFALWADMLVRGFSKAHKYTLGVQIQNEILELMKCVIRGNLRKEKREMIEECFVHYEIVKILIRMANDFRGSGTMTIKQYEKASLQLDEIGKLLGGWGKRFS
jgi:hypothetical protein